MFVYNGAMGKRHLLSLEPLGLQPLETQEFATDGQRAVESNARLRAALEPLFPEDPWGQMNFLYWLRERQSQETIGLDTIDNLADELLLDRDWLQETVALLRDKKQLIFYGPPGTG